MRENAVPMNRGRQIFWKAELYVICLVAALAGCSSSDADQARTQSKIISSSSNSARMTLNAWRRRQVPDAFTRQTLLSMRNNIERAIDEIDTLQVIDVGERDGLKSAARDISSLLTQSERQVIRGDRDNGETVENLKKATDRLLSLTTSQGHST
jgi:hypothetical protein